MCFDIIKKIKEHLFMLTFCISLYFKGRVEVLVQWHPSSGWYVCYSVDIISYII